MSSPDERRVSATATAATVHGRVMELLFVTGNGVTLSAPQVATILGLELPTVIAELRTNRFVQYDEVAQSVRLLAVHGSGGESGRGACGGGGGRSRRLRRNASGEAGVNPHSGGEVHSDEASEEGGQDDHAQDDEDLGRGATRAGPPSPAAAASNVNRDTLQHQQRPSRASPLSLPRDEKSASHSSALTNSSHHHPHTTASSRTRGGGGRRKPASRIGSRHPPQNITSVAATGTAAVTSDLRATAADARSGNGTGIRGSRPVQALLTGRVGYVCAAEEFRLDEMQTYYCNLGYATRVELGVLHVRLPSQSSFSKADASFSETLSLIAGEPRKASPLTDVVGSPTTSSFIRQRMSNFDLFLFEYGAVVWWGSDQRLFKIVETDFLLPDSAAAACMVNRYPTQLVTENYPVWCAYSLVRKESLDVDDDFRRKLRFDHFSIPFGRDGEDALLCTTTMLCCAHALAQSAKIDYLELKVQALTEACAPLPRELRLNGHAHITERRLLQLRGEVLSYRLMLKSGSDLLDEPEFFWEHAYLKPVFEATKEAFGIEDRVEALDNKLDASNEILAMLAEEFSQRHGARLEWIVIWLVFVEVVIGVLELAVDFKPWFYEK